MSKQKDRGGVLVFLFFTLALSSIFYFLINKSGRAGGGGGAYISGLMWCPGLAALLTCAYLRRDVRTLGWNWGKTRYAVVCYFIPLAYGTVTYGLIWLTGIGGVYRKNFVDAITASFGLGHIPPWAAISLYFILTATVGVIQDCATVLGEEIGWRGFLVPELAKRNGFVTTAVVSGLIWALWHYPILFDYNGGTPTWYYMTIFTLGLPLISFIWTWMRLKSGSLWPGVVLHASHNTFIQQFFDPITIDHEKTRYVAGEFGIAIFIVALLLAVYFYSRRGELQLETPEAQLVGSKSSIGLPSGIL
jgi:membrane protease YdiL (CAAX protease family)